MHSSHMSRSCEILVLRLHWAHCPCTVVSFWKLVKFSRLLLKQLAQRPVSSLISVLSWHSMQVPAMQLYLISLQYSSSTFSSSYSCRGSSLRSMRSQCASEQSRSTLPSRTQVFFCTMQSQGMTSLARTSRMRMFIWKQLLQRLIVTPSLSHPYVVNSSASLDRNYLYCYCVRSTHTHTALKYRITMKSRQWFSLNSRDRARLQLYRLALRKKSKSMSHRFFRTAFSLLSSQKGRKAGGMLSGLQVSSLTLSMRGKISATCQYFLLAMQVKAKARKKQLPSPLTCRQALSYLEISLLRVAWMAGEKEFSFLLRKMALEMGLTGYLMALSFWQSSLSDDLSWLLIISYYYIL